MEEFYNGRRELYKQRKIYQLRKLNKELEVLKNKVRFIQEVIDDKIIIKKKPKKVLLKMLDDEGYKRFSKISEMLNEINPFKGKLTKAKGEGGPGEAGEGGEVDVDDSDHDEDLKSSDFDYLLSMSLWSLTEERILELK